MRKLIICVALSAIAQFTGCTEDSGSEQIVQLAQDKILQIKKGLAEGPLGFDHRENRLSMTVLVSEVSNVSQRIELANMYAKTIREVDFAKMTYQQREDSARCYFDHLTSLLKVMKLSACPPRQIVEVYFAGMSKFRDACLGVPLAAKGRDESVADYNWRRDCALKLYHEYAQRISEIKRFWLPELQKYLPDEVHDEYRCRIGPFLRFPTEQEFRQAPMFSGEGRRKIVSPTAITDIGRD